MEKKQGPSHSLKALRRIAALVTVAVLIVAGAVVLVNLLLLPRIAERLERSLENACGCTVSIGSLRYWPLYGIVVRNVTVTRNLLPPGEVDSEDVATEAAISSVGLRVAGIRIHSPELVAIRWMRAPAPDTGNLRDAGNITALFAAAEGAATAGLLPRRISLNRLDLEAWSLRGVSVAAKTKRIELKHNSGGSAILISTPQSLHNTLSGNLQVEYHNRKASGNLRAGPLPLTVVPFSGGTTVFEFSFWLDESSPVDFSGTVTMLDLSLEVPAIAEEPISDLNIDYDFEGFFSRDATSRPSVDRTPLPEGTADGDSPTGELIITTGAISINGIDLEVRPSYHGLYEGPAVFRTTIHLPATEVQSIIDSIPKALRGKLADTRTGGTVSYDLDLRLPMDDISGMRWAADVDLQDFAVLKIDPSVNVYILNDGFVHTLPHHPAGLRRNVRIPPARQASMAWMLEHSEHTASQIERIREQAQAVAASRPPVPSTVKTRSAGKAIDENYRYVYVDEMSPWIIRAVLTAEDGDFFFYGGINPVTFADAVALNLQRREIVVGASTISMQLIKILFLDQKRIFARKIQEAFLVYLMEHQVPVLKDRILELYLNLVEFGPGIYGVFDASQHYFDKAPSELSAGEATWLASVLPSPKTYYRQFEDGQINPHSFRRMVALYDIMLERGRMTPEQYRQAIEGPPEFAPRH